MLTLGLVGCAGQQVAWTVAPIQQAAPFSPSGQADMPDLWWIALDDPALNLQIDHALGGNFTLAAAWERMRAARALARREASDLWPDVDGFGEAAGSFSTEGPDESEFALGVDAAYQVDLWGQIRSRVQAERLRAAATLADYHATALTLSADVARTWFALIEAHAQLALLNEQIETNVTVLGLQESRFAVGQIRLADVLRQQQFVESTREQVVVVLSQIAELEHLLAVLQGRAPQETSYDTGTLLPDLPPLPYTGLPAELVNRRPDVRRDYLALEAADRDLASAITAQYPRINLTASVVTAAEDPGNLFNEWIASVAGQIIGPLFDGGQRRAEVDRTAAVVRQRLAEYGQTVLIAYSEVEDALAREQYQRERIALLNTQLDLARRASVRLREQYIFFGEETDFLDVLSATTVEQRLQRETLSARLDLILTRIALYLALAGDFEGPALEPVATPAPEHVPQ
ncbi:MAG: efflux transporter outer membrane subunit [Pirellulales bacterium]